MPPRTRTARKRKVHQPEKQYSHRLKRLEDRVAVVEGYIAARVSPDPEVTVRLNTPNAAVTIPRSPSSAYRLLPWGHAWPELANFYHHNAPDYSGHKLYYTSPRTSKEYAKLASEEPATFTAQIVLAEFARVDNRYPVERLLWLKSATVQLINAALQDSSRCTSPGTIAAVAAMAGNAILEQDPIASKAHMKGLKRMVDLRGGFDSLDSYIATRAVLVYTDSIYAYFDGADRQFPDWNRPTRTLPSTAFSESPLTISTATQGVFPHLVDATHPLRLALQPLYSNLSAARLRNHLLMSLTSPMTPLMAYLGTINVLAELSLQSPYQKSPQEVRTAAGFIQQHLLGLNSHMKHIQLTHPTYSEMDKLNNQLVFDCVIRAALILVSRILFLINPTEVCRTRLNHNIQMLYALKLRDIVWRNAKIVLWALFLTTSFDMEESLPRKSALQTITQLCQSLEITSGTGLQNTLASVFYSPVLQDDASSKLWYELEPLIKDFTPVTQVLPIEIS